MARLVYACRFEIPSDTGLQSVSASYYKWIEKHYKERRGIADFRLPTTLTDIEAPLDSHNLRGEIYESNEGSAIKLSWSFPDDKDTGLRWRNDIRIGQVGAICSTEHLIYVESVEYNISPTILIVGSPRVIRDIFSDSDVFVGKMRISAQPYCVSSENFSEFITLLTSPDRNIPILFVSPFADSSSSALDIKQLAKNLAGVAVVIYASDPDVTWDLANEIGRRFACFNGGARIYWPNFSLTADYKAHRLFLASWIEQVGSTYASRTIERTIFGVAALRFIPDERISQVIRSHELAERHREIIRKKETGDDFWNDFEKTLADLDDANRRVAELETELSNYKSYKEYIDTQYNEVDNGNAACLEDEAEETHSVHSAVLNAKQKFNNLVFLESALSAALASPFQRPFDIFEALGDLNDIVDDWKQARDERGNGGDLLNHLRNKGWGKRSSMHISNTTKGKYGASYEFEYNGNKILFEPHITIGAGDPNSCASIHFIFDAKNGKMIIAHVGKHLPNTKT